jgi:hypothetical protein
MLEADWTLDCGGLGCAMGFETIWAIDLLDLLRRSIMPCDHQPVPPSHLISCKVFILFGLGLDFFCKVFYLKELSIKLLKLNGFCSLNKKTPAFGRGFVFFESASILADLGNCSATRKCFGFSRLDDLGA